MNNNIEVSWKYRMATYSPPGKESTTVRVLFIGQSSDGRESSIVALIELEGGYILEVNPEYLRFIDEDARFLHQINDIHREKRP